MRRQPLLSARDPRVDLFRAHQIEAMRLSFGAAGEFASLHMVDFSAFDLADGRNSPRIVRLLRLRVSLVALDGLARPI